jgi:hypothetical protein
MLDGSTATGWTNNGGSTGNVSFNFLRKVELHELKWTSRASEGTRSPNNFAIEYSDDGSSWTQAAAFNSTGWGSLEERTFQW